MNELLRSELLRYRLWTAGLAVVHLAVLGFFTRIVDPLQQPLVVYQVAGAIYALCGLLLGLHQFTTHRRSSSWLFLLHRPVPPRRIAFALVGASAISLAVAVALPVALIVVGQELWSARVVDLRHAQLPVAALLLALIAYLGGAFAVLSPARFAVLVLVAPAIVVTGAASGPAALAAQAVTAAALLALVAGAFRPDLTTPPLAAPGQIANAVPLAVGVQFVLVVVGGLAVQIVWIVLGTHPLNSTPPRGGFVEASRAEGKNLLDAGLVAAADASGLAVEREQVRISEVHTLGPQLPRVARRHELTNFAPVEIDDETRNERITFSHDDLLFHRRQLADGAPAGGLGLGAGSATPFPGVPVVDGSGVAILAESVARYDSDEGVWKSWLRAPAGETIASMPESAGEAVALLTDRALLVFEPRPAAEGAELAPRIRVELPAPIGDVARVDFIERLDGLLVSFLIGRDTVDTPGAAWQQVVRVDGDGRTEIVARRDLAPDFPALLRARREWISPLFANVDARLAHLFAARDPLAARGPVPGLPAGLVALAALLHIAAATLAFRWLRRPELAGAVRWSWVAACAFGGPPAAAALWMMRPERFAVAPAGERSNIRPVEAPANVASFGGGLRGAAR